MQQQISFYNKTIHIELSPSAVRQSRALTSRLIIEIQIYFSCLLGKRLVFYSEQPVEGAWQLDSEAFDTILEQAKPITDKLYLRFNTVMTKDCPVADYAGPPPVTDFVIRNQTPYVPDWLNIDFNSPMWSGEYGWQVTNRHANNTKQVRAPVKPVKN